MRVLFKYIFGLVFIFFGGSCEDVYYPTEISSKERIPVIQGIIEDGKTPIVNLSWAMGYTDKVQDFITGATVTVSDNLGDSVILEESVGGNYTTLSNSFTGIHGNVYTLRVILPDGNIYASSPVYMPGRPVIDSLYAEPGLKTVYIKNWDNELVPQIQKGLYIKTDLSAQTDSLLYYRFSTKVVKLMVLVTGIGTAAEHPVYGWEVNFLDTRYSVGFSTSRGRTQILPQHNIGFLRYFYDSSLESRIQTAPYTVGWVLIFNVYSISQDVYNYYNSISQQLDANDQIFAPVPSQVKSNIHCINNTGNKVVGVFEAASSSKIYKAFGWKDLKTYYSRQLSSFPDDIHGGSRPNFPPNFWVIF